MFIKVMVQQKFYLNDKEIFTCSIHCKNNFPFRKSKSDLDVELDNGLNDHEYLDIL